MNHTPRTRRAPAACAGLLLTYLLGSTSAAADPTPTDTPADTLYHGGVVLTLDPAHPRAEAIAVRAGRVLAVGEARQLRAAHAGPATRELDLRGRALLPGFVDGHSHLGQALALVDWADLSAPPTGRVDTIAALIEMLRAHVRERRLAAGDWVIGYGYDNEALAEARHLTRDELDAAFPDHPVLLMQVSGHGMVLNSPALARAGIDAGTPTPPGGVIARRAGSEEPNGLLMETAMVPVYAVLPRPDAQAQMAALDRVQRLYASNGYTTIQDGATSPETLGLLDAAAARGTLWLDVVSLPAVMHEADLDQALAAPFGRYTGRHKRGGIKVIGDGSPQGRTAWFTHPMHVAGPGGEQDWSGVAFIPDADYAAILARVLAAGVPLWTHANGDAAIDMVIRAHERAGVNRDDDRRHVVVHSQFVRPDQLDAYARLGLAASFFSNHAFYWGDVHLRNLGPGRARFLSPLASAHARGVRYSNHSDYAVTPLDPAMILWTAVNRLTRSGVVVGPDERVPVERALAALTIDASWIYREEDDKGSLAVGKRADFAILDRDPLATDPQRLRELRVVATVKDGKLVWGSL